jgi:hypothetical protein
MGLTLALGEETVAKKQQNDCTENYPIAHDKWV